MLNDYLLPTASQLEIIARETSLIQRTSSKFSAAGFLLTMLQSVTKGDVSLNQIAMHLASFVPKSMTRQAMFQRFGPSSSHFFLKVIQSVVKQRHPAVLDAHHIEAMVLAAMFYQLIIIHLHAKFSHKDAFSGWLSIEKLSDAFSIHLMRLTNIAETWRFDPDPRHLRYEKRNRINHWQSIIHSLA